MKLIWYINHLKQSCRKHGRRLTPCFVFLISSGFQQTLVLFKAHSLGFFDKRALTCIVRSWEIILPLRSTNSQFPFCLEPCVTSYCIFRSGWYIVHKIFPHADDQFEGKPMFIYKFVLSLFFFCFEWKTKTKHFFKLKTKQNKKNTLETPPTFSYKMTWEISYDQYMCYIQLISTLIFT